MFIFETYDFAPLWMKVATNNVFDAVAVIRAKDKFNDGPYWRDRTDEVKKMLVGFGNEDDTVFESIYTGEQLKEMGCNIQKEQFTYNYKVIWK